MVPWQVSAELSVMALLNDPENVSKFLNCSLGNYKKNLFYLPQENKHSKLDSLQSLRHNPFAGKTLCSSLRLKCHSSLKKAWVPIKKKKLKYRSKRFFFESFSFQGIIKFLVFHQNYLLLLFTSNTSKAWLNYSF